LKAAAFLASQKAFFDAKYSYSMEKSYEEAKAEDIVVSNADVLLIVPLYAFSFAH